MAEIHFLGISDSNASSEFRQTAWRPLRLAVASTALLMLSACGGGGDATKTAEVTPPAVPVPTLVPVPVPVVASCLDGSVNNVLGAADPFHANSWQLENTGPTQVVSASTNRGLAGIDANVKGVHRDGRGCTGKNITIAIVDSGLELAHEDLTGNVVLGKSFNFSDNSSDPTPSLAAARAGPSHGTAVAGIAAAQGWNGKGAHGTAPFASLVGYNLIGPGAIKVSSGKDTFNNAVYLAFGALNGADPTIEATTVFGTRANDVSVFNFSAGAYYAAAPLLGPPASQQDAAKIGTQQLRGGLGAIYLQSAGNGYMNITGSLPDGKRLPVNCKDVLTADLARNGPLAGSTFSNLAGQTCASPNQEPSGKPYFYQVAAIHNTGMASSYSSSGAANWITGFAGENGDTTAAIISTDDSGCDKGHNNTSLQAAFVARFPMVADALKAIADLFGMSSIDPQCNYTGRMNGTSAAAPSVAGVTALLLEVNPALTWQDVGYILAKTARKVDNDIATGARAATYTASGTLTSLDLDKPWQTNSAGFNFQNRYGFGLVDANAAAVLARGFTAPVGRRAIDVVATGSASIPVALGNDKYTVNSANVAFAVPGTAVTGQMQLELEVTNATGGDVNPGMIQFEMKNNRTGQVSVVLPAFTAWYRGGKNFPLLNNGMQKFKMHTNAFYGDKLSDGYTVTLTYVKALGQTGGTLSFQPVVTSFSL